MLKRGKSEQCPPQQLLCNTLWQKYCKNTVTFIFTILCTVLTMRIKYSTLTLLRVLWTPSARALNLFPVKYPRVIKQPEPPACCLWNSLTRTLPQVNWQSCGFHIVESQQRKIRQNLRGVFNRHAFSSSIGYQNIVIHENSTAIQVPLEIFPWTPGGSRTPGGEPLP